MPTRWIIGLAPGSSIGGVDVALLEIQGSGLELRVRLVQALHWPYARDLRNLILRFSSTGPCEMKQLSLLHRLMGETLAMAARKVADQASFSLQQTFCVGCPGHCIWQEPDGRYPSFLEVGMPAVVAERTGLTTISDFRTRDVAAGGHGVPVESLADCLFFRHPHENRVLVHLGGVATLVYVPAGGDFQDVIGFEAGPCNLLLDSLMRKLSAGKETHDPGGKHAVQGRCIEALLERWLDLPHWQRRPPKALSPHTFGEEFATEAVRLAQENHWDLHDLLCTTTHLVARGIVLAVQRFLPPGRRPDRVLLSGGGTRNGLLWHILEQHLSGASLARTDTAGVPADSRRAMAFGVLAALATDGVPANVPSATGAAGARLLGSMTPGSSANWARCLAWMAAQSATAYRLSAG